MHGERTNGVTPPRTGGGGETGRASRAGGCCPGAFTLVELLVVVAIISVLLAVMLPSLNRARGLARRTACSSNLRQFSVANAEYAAQHNRYYVPLSMPPSRDGTAWGVRWMQNDVYMTILGADKTTGFFNTDWPNDLLCPDLPPEHYDRPWSMWRCYAFNETNIPTQWEGRVIIRAIRRTRVTNPSRTAQMIDASDWHTFRRKANYKIWWDQWGEQFGSGQWAMVAYRHREGANIVHFDGHVSYYKKQEAWSDDPARNDRLWAVYPSDG